MKLKQLLSGILTGAIALGSVVLPSSAATTRAASIIFTAPESLAVYNMNVSLNEVVPDASAWVRAQPFNAANEFIAVTGLSTGSTVRLTANGRSLDATVMNAYVNNVAAVPPTGRIDFADAPGYYQNALLTKGTYSMFYVSLELSFPSLRYTGTRPDVALGFTASTTINSGLALTLSSGSPPTLSRTLSQDGEAAPTTVNNSLAVGGASVITSTERPYMKTGVAYPVYSLGAGTGTGTATGNYLTAAPSGFVHYGDVNSGNDFYYNSSNRQYFNRVNDPYNYAYYNETTKQYLYPRGYNNGGSYNNGEYIYVGGGNNTTGSKQLINNSNGRYIYYELSDTILDTNTGVYYRYSSGRYISLVDGYTPLPFTPQFSYTGYPGTGYGSYSSYTIITSLPAGFTIGTSPSYYVFTPITDPSGYGYTCYVNDYTRQLLYPNGAPSHVGGTGSYPTQQSFNLVSSQVTSLLKGRDFTVTVTLANNNSSYYNNALRFTTNLGGSTGITAYSNYNQYQVTFTNVPASYFYNSNGTIFNSFTVYNGYSSGTVLNYDSIVINYNEVTEDETTTTSKPSTTTIDEDEPTEPAENELSVNFTELTLNVGASAYLVTSEDVKWSKLKSGGSNISIYTNGKVLAKAAGTSYVRARNDAGDMVQIKVTVKSSSRPRTSFALKTKSGVVYTDSAYSLATYTASPSNTTDTVSWASSDPYVATVDQNGRVTVRNVGTVTITALTSSGLTSTCKLTAKNPSITLSATTGSVKVGGTYTIKATAKPSSSRLTYESLNESVAKVSASGVVTGVARGTARIQISSNKGVVRVFTITVTN
jgi:uncharacterized protein YjdB